MAFGEPGCLSCVDGGASEKRNKALEARKWKLLDKVEDGDDLIHPPGTVACWLTHRGKDCDRRLWQQCSGAWICREGPSPRRCPWAQRRRAGQGAGKRWPMGTRSRARRSRPQEDAAGPHSAAGAAENWYPLQVMVLSTFCISGSVDISFSPLKHRAV